MKPEVDVDGTMSGFLVESVTSQLILKSQQVDVVSQGHFSHAVRVEVKLVLDDFRKVLRNSNKNIMNSKMMVHSNFQILFRRFCLEVTKPWPIQLESWRISSSN